MCAGVSLHLKMVEDDCEDNRVHVRSTNVLMMEEFHFVQVLLSTPFTADMLTCLRRMSTNEANVVSNESVPLTVPVSHYSWQDCTVHRSFITHSYNKIQSFWCFTTVLSLLFWQAKLPAARKGLLDPLVHCSEFLEHLTKVMLLISPGLLLLWQINMAAEKRVFWFDLQLNLLEL